VTVRRTARALRRAREWFVQRSAEWQVRLALGAGLVGSNAVGIGVVYVLTTIVVPMPDVAGRDSVRLENLALAGVYVLVAGTLGIVHAWRRLHPVVVMIRPGGDPSEDDQRKVLAAPRRIFLFQALLWAVGSFVFFGANAHHSWVFAVSILLIVGLAGWTTSSLTYLLAERALRPVAGRVLRRGVPERRYVRSVASRSMFAWALGTGFTVLGIVLIGTVALVDHQHVATKQLALTTIVLGGITIVVGGFSSYVAAQASSDPIRNLREAYGLVEDGDFDVEVPIYDGTEIGMLQAGFNEMLHGLKEREELRDLFGRHVGVHVARSALEQGVQLGGESREVAVLFVDIIGSTGLAENRPPEEVVALLNRFFEVVIDVVHEHDGWINKFEGDAALAVWGAPVDTDDRQTAALRAARILGSRLEDEVPEIRAGIGVSCGTAVAGNVGTAERYEYTVIGDPVNEAARLTGLAKKVPARVVASQGLVSSATEEEAAHWKELEPVTVRGRTRPTRIATPV
jgi:adenylate cyclase